MRGRPLAVLLGLLSGLLWVGAGWGVLGAVLTLAYNGPDFLPFVGLAAVCLLGAGLSGGAAVRAWKHGEGKPGQP